MDCGNGQGTLSRGEYPLSGWQGTVEMEHLVKFYWLQRWLEDESPGEEELNSWPQTTVFSVAVAG